jgi:hypothetical protein
MNKSKCRWRYKVGPGHVYVRVFTDGKNGDLVFGVDEWPAIRDAAATIFELTDEDISPSKVSSVPSNTSRTKIGVVVFDPMSGDDTKAFYALEKSVTRMIHVNGLTVKMIRSRYEDALEIRVETWEGGTVTVPVPVSRAYETLDVYHCINTTEET